MQNHLQAPARVPMFNIPAVVLVSGALMAAIHGIRAFLLSEEYFIDVLIWFAFIPMRYLAEADAWIPTGFAVKVWTFATYGLLHGDFTHLLVNLFWMAAFGSALARRFRATRFLIFSAVCAIAGAVLHLAFFWGDRAPLIGASAAISGHMAAIARFGFSPGGPMTRSFRLTGQNGWTVPALSIIETLMHRRALVFLGVWFAINFVFGIAGGPLVGENAQIAWQAHVGGFLAGLLLFPLFDPIPREPHPPWPGGEPGGDPR